jgi:threonine dehydratase
MYSLESLETAASAVYRVVPPTPQICWPLLSERAGAEVWVKHENHSPVGAFKLRGGLVYMEELKVREPDITGVIAATRGNHGQSVTFAAARAGLRAVIVVPHGNSREKNAAMRTQGAKLIEHGVDFQDAYEHAVQLATARNLHMVPSFDDALVRGVASYALELFRGAPKLDAVYVPIGMGSGICATIAVRDALGLSTEVIGVVATRAPAYALSFAAGRVVTNPVEDTIADGMACRTPDQEALEIMLKGASRIVTVDDDEIGAAMRHLFSDTHNAAEGAGAAALAGLLKEGGRMKGRRVGVILSGGNVDRDVFARTLAADSSAFGVTP